MALGLAYVYRMLCLLKVWCNIIIALDFIDRMISPSDFI